MNQVPQPRTKALLRRIRVRKKDSAFVYCIMEAHEGVTSYSTLEQESHELYRDLLLMISPDYEEDADRMLKQLGEMVYEMEASS